MRRIFYIDPMSYNNLAIYDHDLLEEVSDHEIFYFHNKKYAFKAFTNKNIVLFPIFVYSDKRYLIRGISYIYSLLNICVRVLLDKPVAIHIQWTKLWVADYTLLKVLKLIRPELKIIYTAHNVLPHNGTKKDVDRYARYYRAVDWIICHVKASKSEIMKLFNINENKIIVIPHGLLDYRQDDEVVNAQKNHIVESYSLRGKTVISFLGVQHPYKGVDLLARAWASSKSLSESNDAFLLIMGRNDRCDYSSIVALRNVGIEDRHISDAEFVAVLRLTDVLVMPYRRISQSGVLLASINERTPFMVTNVGGITEPLEHADVGWNIGEPTVENVRSCLERIVGSDEMKRFKNNTAGWNKLAEFYSWRSIAKKTVELYSIIK